jgi:hypothetical protein
LRVAIGQRALRTVEERYKLRRIGQRYIELYEGLLSRPQTKSALMGRGKA